MGKKIKKKKFLGVGNVVRKYSGSSNSEGFASYSMVTKLINPEWVGWVIKQGRQAAAKIRRFCEPSQ